MNIIDLINKKKNGQKLSQKELQFFIDAVCKKQIKDYQISAMLMAMFLKGLDFDETYNLTISMANSGEVINLDDIGEVVDKHSTGGVSDTTTLVFVPVLASLGVKVAKMSGRSLGWTGGTADKMEVFNGYKTEISSEKFKELIKLNNASIITQSQSLALADKILYKMRSETATVDNMSLIASSIMSKKIASGAKTILLDVKYGSGAFMKTLDEAKTLARMMVEIGKRAGLKVSAVLSNMNQPLTRYIGNNLEVYSAIKVLNGEENNLSNLSKFLCSKILLMTGCCKDFDEANLVVTEAITTKKAINKLKQIVKSQGGSVECLENPEILLPKNNHFDLFSNQSGFLSAIDTTKLGNIAHSLQIHNGEIVRQDDCGIILEKAIGDYVNVGDKLLTVYYNNVDDIEEIKNSLLDLFEFSQQKQNIELIDSIID